MTLKIRIVLYLTFNTKSNQIPRTFLWPFSLTFGLAYPLLNSATLSCSSEVTLLCNTMGFLDHWVKFYHFWPKHDDEKWSGKNIFEIFPCALSNYKHIFYFIHRRIFAKVTNSVTKITIFAHGGISKKMFVVYVLMMKL